MVRDDEGIGDSEWATCGAGAHPVAQPNTWRSAQVRAETRRARAAIRADLPSAAARGSVWGVAMLKDEIDIVDPVLWHLVTQGVDRILWPTTARQTAPSSGCTSWPASSRWWSCRTPTRRTSSRQDEPLSRIAGRAGADWVVPFDADEFWFAPGARLADWLRSSGLDVVDARIDNAFPLPGTDHEPLAEREHRFDLTPHHLPNVAFRRTCWSLEMGNHFISRPGRRAAVRSSCTCRGARWNSRRAGARRQRGARRGSGPGPRHRLSHARRLDDAELAGIWERLLEGEGDERLAWSPKGPFRVERALQRTTWDG